MINKDSTQILIEIPFITTETELQKYTKYVSPGYDKKVILKGNYGYYNENGIFLARSAHAIEYSQKTAFLYADTLKMIDSLGREMKAYQMHDFTGGFSGFVLQCTMFRKIPPYI